MIIQNEVKRSSFPIAAIGASAEALDSVLKVPQKEEVMVSSWEQLTTN
jgi:hypothetical protein